MTLLPEHCYFLSPWADAAASLLGIGGTVAWQK